MKRSLGSLCEQALDQMRERGWEPELELDQYRRIAAVGLIARTLPLAFVACDIVEREQPLTLRGLFYLIVSEGWLPSTDKQHYTRLRKLTVKLREKGVVPFEWFVDHVRATLKLSSWSGLADYVDTVKDAYRKNFWASLSDYVHVFVEKDAMAGVLEPVTRDYDVPLSVIRGNISLSFAYEIAQLWKRFEKPVFAYYSADHDPSGLDLERDLQAKLRRYGAPDFTWERLGVCPTDFETFNLFPLEPKKTDSRMKRFLAQGYTKCAELDAIPATALRARLERAINEHIPAEEWERLRRIEELERQQWEGVMRKFGKKVAAG